MDYTRFQKEFLDRLDGSRGLGLLFDYLPEIHLFVKNRHSQFVKINRTLLKMLGLEHENQMLGKTDMDFYPEDVATKYIEEDRQVMSQEVPFINKVWLVPGSDGLLVWYLCTKIPLYSREGEVIGIAGTLRDYETAGAVLEPYNEMATVVEYITNNYAREIRIEDLAAMVHLSESQFTRKFKKLFQVTPVKYITKVRINAACHALSQSDTGITQVAQETGFYDHSYFTKKFTSLIGLTPRQYRKQYYAAD